MHYLKQLIVLLVILAAGVWIGGAVRGWSMTAVGETAPQHRLVDWQGVEGVLPSDGEAQLLYLFAPWCTICDLTIDHVAALERSGRPVQLVALSYQNRAELSAFLERHPGLGPIWLGHDAVSRDYGVPAFPAYVIVDAQGTILARRVGYLPEWALKAYMAWYGV
ncbi:TlpA family protein disulfide reductase [Ferrimonas balearica]|uniref:TlpA family protein disulfide reductase n=1 Tax=Ferrimonas balearica TaxID=44012 RepID=UPI001C9958FE|nr:TlpA disulfide reductase family protein [Ferrimonas balearica]MBY5991663.1 TlpA family protein disulfide reductase [Ferrimonas balearica]